MKYLLDTCAMLWALQDTARLSATARKSLQNSQNTIAVSVVSYWEISLKRGLGKLTLDGAEPEDFPRFVAEAGWSTLPLSPETAASSGRLPLLPHHRDSFDRLLVWSALRENLTLVSRDGIMRAYAPYGLKVCW